MSLLQKMNIKLNNKNIEYVLNKLNNSGFEAYLVGGCVRDFCLNIEPKDFDICTNATPDEIKNIFEKTYDLGIKFGTVGVNINNEIIEVTTYRTETNYVNNRKPEVKFVSNLTEDLKRRDFTINAMAYNKELIDPYDGLADLNNKLIRCVGDPEGRFKEDALRILRMIRFASKYNFNIDKETLQAALKHTKLLDNISKERKIAELEKILCCKFLKNIFTDVKDILEYTYPDLAFKKILMNDIYTNTSFSYLTKISFLIKNISSNFEYYFIINKELNISKMITRYRNTFFKNDYEIKVFLYIYGLDVFKELLNLLNLIDNSTYINLNDRLNSIIKNIDIYNLKQLKINGDDLLSIGYKNKSIKFLLEEVLSKVMLKELNNDKTEILNAIKNNLLNSSKTLKDEANFLDLIKELELRSNNKT